MKRSGIEGLRLSLPHNRIAPREAKRPLPLLLFLLFITNSTALAQLSGYVSLSSGYNENPLYNYEKLGDNQRQGYLELAHLSLFPVSQIKIHYTGGLVLFNRFQERNYYEHSLTAKYSWTSALPAPRKIQSEDEEESPDSMDVEAAGDSSETEESSVQDSSDADSDSSGAYVEDTTQPEAVSADTAEAETESSETFAEDTTQPETDIAETSGARVDATDASPADNPQSNSDTVSTAKVETDTAGQTAGVVEESDGEENEEVEEEEPPHPLADSTATLIEFGIKAGARHDKAAFKEFDNTGAELLGLIRHSFAEKFQVRAVNSLAHRRYTYLPQLSNMTNLLSVTAGSLIDSGFRFGATASFGYKRYTETVYDTSRFELAKSYTIKDTGKGKLGGKIKVPSKKDILIQPQKNGTAQMNLQLFVEKAWTGGSLTSVLIYRKSFDANVRYLAQYANTSILSEDIYNDFFNYQGMEGGVTFTQTLFAGINLSVACEAQRKRFTVQALDLSGEDTGEKRKDIRYAMDVTLSRYFEITDAIGLDVSLSANFVRNQSTDAYNDFSGNTFLAGFGVGF